MSVNSYLNDLAQRAITKGREGEKINISVKNILGKLDSHFADEIEKISRYGSHKRHTNLSKIFDDNLDIDIMIIFSDNSYKPQTYLSWLKKFAELSYSRSEIYQSFPSVVLELNHVKFDLVPAIICGDKYKIPSKQNSDWITTNPNDLDGALVNNQTLRRLVRVAKIWNAKQGYICESYELEKWIVGQYFYGNLAEHFYQFCQILPLDYSLSQDKQRKILKLRDSAAQANYNNDESYIKGLFE